MTWKEEKREMDRCVRCYRSHPLGADAYMCNTCTDSRIWAPLYKPWRSYFAIPWADLGMDTID